MNALVGYSRTGAFVAAFALMGLAGLDWLRP